jgi:hypothetical protein
MVKMTIELLDRKVSLITKLTHCFFIVVIHLLKFTAITIILILFWDFLQAIAGKMKAGIA